jgi:hypothetical protein
MSTAAVDDVDDADTNKKSALYLEILSYPVVSSHRVHKDVLRNTHLLSGEDSAHANEIRYQTTSDETKPSTYKQFFVEDFYGNTQRNISSLYTTPLLNDISVGTTHISAIFHICVFVSTTCILWTLQCCGNYLSLEDSEIAVYDDIERLFNGTQCNPSSSR